MIGINRHVKSIIMDTQTYTAYLPVATPDFTADPPSIVRKIPGHDPVKDVYSTDMTCNLGAQPLADDGVARVGEVTAGSVAQYFWNEWSHLSPIHTYMARCDPDCGSFTGTEGDVWFKIEERTVDETGEWASQQLHDDNFRWNVTIPACLAPGQYLIRHEIIQLTSAREEGECQFYMNCAQVNVIGDGTLEPTELVALPGAYSPTDPGVLWDSYTQDPLDYVMPGPRPLQCP